MGAIHGRLELIIALALLLNLFASSDAEAIERLIIERSGIHGANPTQVLRVARCESRLNPNAIGASGERGIAQWHPRGIWYSTPAYREQGIDIRVEYIRGNTDAVYFDVDQMAWAFSRGYASHWSCK